jgi:hypothetical protein
MLIVVFDNAAAGAHVASVLLCCYKLTGQEASAMQLQRARSYRPLLCLSINPVVRASEMTASRRTIIGANPSNPHHHPHVLMELKVEREDNTI